MGERFGIGQAVEAMRMGKRVRRLGWNGRGMFLFLVEAWSDYAKSGPGWAEPAPFVAMKTADNKTVPWLCSQTDLLAVDWELEP